MTQSPRTAWASAPPAGRPQQWSGDAGELSEVNGARVVGLVAAGFAIVGVIVVLVAPAAPWSWLAYGLVFGGAGLAALDHLRPPRVGVVGPAVILVLASLLLAFVIPGFKHSAEIFAAAATSAWLMLRGHAPVRQAFALVAAAIAFLFWLVLPAPWLVLDGVPLSLYQLVALVIPVTAAAWLASMGSLPAVETRTVLADVTAAMHERLRERRERRAAEVAGPRPRGKTNPLAPVSLVLALVHLSPLAIIVGHVASRQIRERGGRGDGLAFSGLVIGYLALPLDLAVVVMLFVFGIL